MNVRRLVLGAAIVGLALAGAPGPAMAATAPHEFRIVKLGDDADTVIATGPFYGVGTETNTRHMALPGKKFTAVFRFPFGDLYLDAFPAPPQIDADPASCVTYVTLQVNNAVTGGTGVYAGATGAGSGISHLTQIRERADDGTCLPFSSPPTFELANVRAVETITLP